MLCRIDPKFLLLIMKFTYAYANLNDVEILYDTVKKAKVNYPMKNITQVKRSVLLRQPVAISDYLVDINPFQKMPLLFENRFWENYQQDEVVSFYKTYKGSTDFVPVLTDGGLCSAYNVPPPDQQSYEPSSVADFREVFAENNNFTLKTAAMKSYTFIVDTKKRMQYPFRTTNPRSFVRYVYGVKILIPKQKPKFKFHSHLFFRIALNEPEEYFNVIEDAIPLEGGSEVTIKVIPEEIVTPEDVGPAVSIEKRNCRMKDEVPEKMKNMFRSYSRSACLFHCMYLYA